MRGKMNLFFQFDKIVKETEKAYLISKNNVEIWFPKSQSKVCVPPMMGIEENNWLAVTEWLAKQKNIPIDWNVYAGGAAVSEDDCEYDEYGYGEMAWWEVQ